MAGGKKKKEKKKSSGSLSHIASHLVPSAIFAAAPRSASPSATLSSTWPRRTQVSQAIGSAGNVGWAFVGNMNRTLTEGSPQSDASSRAPADLPAMQTQEESTYETVEVGKDFDKTTKFAMQSSDEGPSGVKHTYHVLEDASTEEPKKEPVYAKVDKSKKKSKKGKENASHEYEDVTDGLDDVPLSSDDDLTDVTSNDEESSSIVQSKGKKSQKKTKPQKSPRNVQEEVIAEQQGPIEKTTEKVENITEHNPEENIDSEPKKKSKRSKKRNSIDTVEDSTSHHQNPDNLDGKMSPTEPHNSMSGNRKSSKKSSLKRRSQVAPDDDLESPENSHNAVEVKERHLQSDRIGFEGTSQKVDLSDISEDEEGIALRAYPIPKPINKRLLKKMIVNEEITRREADDLDVENAPPSSLFDEVPEESVRKISKANDSSTTVQFDEQKKQLETLIKQQEDVYKQQAQQQQDQQIQAATLAQQQRDLQIQLEHLEDLRNDRLLNLSNSSFDQEFKIPKDVLEQQERLIEKQQQQQEKYESQQDKVLKQQQQICDQIKDLEYQQKELQSNLSLLHPKEADLAEIRWQEKEIIRLLNEQQSHQQRYEKLHRLQQEQLEKQAMKFQQEREVLERQQEALQAKMKEQEEISKKLEIELQNISSIKPVKKQRKTKLVEENEDEVIPSSQADEVDAIPVSSVKEKKSQASGRHKRKKSKNSVQPTINSLEVLTLENSRLLELNASLQNENLVLRKVTETVENSPGAESLVTQQYIKDLQQENKVLKDTIHRLNMELTRYQLKYRPATAEDVDDLVFPKSPGSSPWLSNTKFLAPLFVAYDDRLKERDEIIRVYDEEMNAFKSRLMEIVKENQDLHLRLTKSKPDALELDEWQQLQEQAKLVVEENSILMKQQELQQRKVKEMHQMHGQDVSKLSLRITKLESEKNALQTELKDKHLCQKSLQEKVQVLLADEDKKMPVEEHLHIMDECRSIMEEMKQTKVSESQELQSKLEAVNQEKQNLASTLADSHAQITQLTTELDIYRKTQRKLERKNLLLQRKLEHILDREISTQQTLDEVLKIAEKTAEERDSFEEMAKTQKLKQKKSKSLLEQGDLNILGLQEKLKSSKRKSSEKVAIITGRLSDKEKEVNKIKVEHEKEINRLRDLVREKQKVMEDLMDERQLFNQQLDDVWKKADLETQEMKKTIHKDTIYD